MVDGSFPYRLESRRAQLDDRRVIGYLMAGAGAVAGEITEADEAIVEYPEVVAGQREVGRTPSGQPSHLLPGGDVHRVSDVVLEPDVRRHRLGDDARSPHDDPARQRVAGQGVPVRLPLGAVIRRPALPGDERWIVRYVGVAHLHVHSRALRSRDQLL